MLATLKTIASILGHYLMLGASALQGRSKRIAPCLVLDHLQSAGRCTGNQGRQAKSSNTGVKQGHSRGAGCEALCPY